MSSTIILISEFYLKTLEKEYRFKFIPHCSFAIYGTIKDWNSLPEEYKNKFLTKGIILDSECSIIANKDYKFNLDSYLNITIDSPYKNLSSPEVLSKSELEYLINTLIKKTNAYCAIGYTYKTFISYLQDKKIANNKLQVINEDIKEEIKQHVLYNKDYSLLLDYCIIQYNIETLYKNRLYISIIEKTLNKWAPKTNHDYYSISQILLSLSIFIILISSSPYIPLLISPLIFIALICFYIARYK